MRYAELRPQLPASLFPPPKPRTEPYPAGQELPRMNVSRRRSRNDSHTATDGVEIFDEYDDNVLNDRELMAAGKNLLVWLDRL